MIQQPIRTGSVDLQPRYDPWIGEELAPILRAIRAGEDVSTGGAERLLVLGESHYSRPGDPDSYDDHPGLTREVVRDWAINPEQRSAFFTRVGTLAQAGTSRSATGAEAWRHFAFAEYVQSLVTTGPRTAPTGEQWDDAGRRFFGLLALTRPCITVVLGNRLWQNLPSLGVRTPPMQLYRETPVEDVWFYPYQDDEQYDFTFAVKVAHPSAGFGNWDPDRAARIVATVRYHFSNLGSYMIDRWRESGTYPYEDRSTVYDKEDLNALHQELEWPIA